MPSRFTGVHAPGAARPIPAVACALLLSTALGCEPTQRASRQPEVRRQTEQPTLAQLFEPHPSPTTPQTAPAAAEPPPPVDEPPPRQAPIVMLQTRFDILRVRVAKGVFSESGKIWNHLNEESLPATTAALLQKNGLRVASGRPDSWPPIQALFEQERKQERTIETSSSNMTLANGLPLMIDVDQHRMRDQTLFVFRPDGTLGGVTCPMSTNLIRIEYTVPVEDPSAVQVDVMPQIEQQQVLATLTVNELGQLDQPVQRPTRVLRELALRLVVPPDHFIVIGPSAAAWQGHLAGSLLLCEEIDGKPYESMYFITPRLQRTEQKAPP